MSGASDKVLSAIHVTPEAGVGGPLARLRDGDVLSIDTAANRFEALVDAAEFAARLLHQPDEVELSPMQSLFGVMRNAVGDASRGASVCGAPA